MPFPLPATVFLHPNGEMDGRTRRYQKRFNDLAGLFLDEEAFRTVAAERGDVVAYQVDEYRPSDRAGDVIFGTSTLEPGRIGEEFLFTRGHIHALGDRPEIYLCQSGRGVMLMELEDGTIRAEEMTPGKLVYVAPFWIHRSVNVGDEPLVTLFCYPADAGQDYGIIERAGGMAALIVPDGADGWKQVPNPRYRPRSAAGAA
ncbi:glucose-6-phosphate isomerase [Rhizosaccharibacter radicis]|uniref:glucose-6-phosphate isomerase n=1 Tax=Rhizosaccharibacter radicis TaxID=2782605 RepID=A0ABT1W1D1_9PROT|nr:glucose-6-phosphate isomerase [Acetobacteraceae bacterium KSS12]